MRILVVDDEKSLRVALADELSDAGHAVIAVGSGEEALERLAADEYDLVITDLLMGSVGGMQLLDHVKSRALSTEVVVITAHATVETALEALKKGAVDYLCKPFEIDHLLNVVRNVRETIRLRRENEELKSRLYERHRFHSIVGKSAAMQRVFELLGVVCASGKTVLVQGETGTGKELVAEAIHYNGPRRDKPFVSVSCAALSRELLESELFGHEKGAFTGAIRERRGRFELAHGGTLFLDEVDDIPLETQVKLLRVIETGKFERVGGEQTLQVDARLVASTKRELLRLVEEGRFRRDLYYRLNVIQITLPPLRERKEDIPLLVGHFLAKYAPGRTLEVSPEIMELLLQYRWDGNVRELEHAVERMILLGGSGPLSRGALPREIAEAQPADDQFAFGTSSLPDHLYRIERRILAEALSRVGGSKSKVAAMLRIPLPTLKSKLRKFEL